jgi:DNA-binding NarL/FixJ family response regulator
MKILVVDDHVLFREGLKLILGRLDASIVVLEANDLEEGLGLTARHDDLVLALFDLGLPGMHGIDALTKFRQEREDLPTVVLSAQEDPQTVMDALARGAMGFIPKTASLENLHAALKVVLGNGIYVPSLALGAVRPPVAPKTAASAATRHLSELGLTDRQMQVFKLIVQGKSNKMIANQLSIAESTIKQHVKPILKSLNVTSRVGAILEVARRGMSLD